MLVKTVTMAEEPNAMVPARSFRQINGILGAHAPGTTPGLRSHPQGLGRQSLPGLRGVVNDGGGSGGREPVTAPISRPEE